MGFFDKLAFWKHDNTLDTPPLDLGDISPNNMQSASAYDATGLGDLGYSGMNTPQDSAAAPASFNMPPSGPSRSAFTPSPPPQYSASLAQNTGNTRDLDVLNAKLDTIKAMLDTILRRLDGIEAPPRPQPPRW